MSVPVPPTRPWWRVVDWRLVAAAGLPVWAFFAGMLVPRTAGPVVAAPQEPPPVVTPVEVDEPIPPPRAIVIRETEPVVLTVPVVVPVVEEVVAVPPAQEFKLPDTEVLPADKCKKFGTTIRFHSTPVEAATEAKAAKKLVMVLHISGNFEDPGFT